MVESPGGTEGAARPPAALEPGLHLLVSFLLDIADIARKGGSILDVLIITIVVEANVAGVSRDPELQRQYGSLATPPPDAVRRPVSVSAVAAAAGLPHETVRRRLARLAERGECLIGPKGVVVPTSRHAAADYVQLAVERYERTRRLYHDLRRAGALVGPAQVPAAPAQELEPPIRLCNRLLSEYYLKVLNLLVRRVGDPVSGLILLGLARANMAARRDSEEILERELLTPVRRKALAAQLGLPPETVRRRLNELEAKGYCRIAPGGVVIDTAALSRPEAVRLYRETEANLRRFLFRLRRTGVLGLWDADLAACSPPAPRA